MLTFVFYYDKLHLNDLLERGIGMKKIYEEPVLDIEKFQFEQILGVSQDDNIITDPFGDDDD